MVLHVMDLRLEELAIVYSGSKDATLHAPACGSIFYKEHGLHWMWVSNCGTQPMVSLHVAAHAITENKANTCSKAN